MRLNLTLASLLLAALVAAVPPPGPSLAADPPSAGIRVTGAQITIDMEVEIPARETGVLRAVLVRHGQVVKADEVLGQLDDDEAQLDAREAAVEFNKAKEAADSDVEVRAAMKSRDVALAELQRSLEAVERFEKSISRTEIDRLRLAAERAGLAIEQAELVHRAAGLDAELKKVRVDRMQHLVEKLKLRSTVNGVVVQIDKDPGESVQNGTTVFRVLRLDRLRCEAQVPGGLVDSSMVGRPVQITVAAGDRKPVTVTGRLAFVDPRVNPIQEDTRIWAEFENPGFTLRPGLKAEMLILPPAPAVTSAR